MVWWFLVLCALALGHYVYEAIWLPTYRQKSRNSLFKLRDELRLTLISEQTQLSQAQIETFKLVDDSINGALSRLHKLTIINVVKFQIAAETSDDFRAKVESKVRKIKECEHPVPWEVYRKVNQKLELVLMANSAGIMFYFLPFVLISMVIGSIWKKMKGMTDSFVTTLISLPTGQAERLFSKEKFISV